MAQDAKVDLIIPIYNSEAYLDALLEALEKQTFREFRVIFVDDGSTDQTYTVLQKRLEQVHFPSLLLQQENQGPSAARNLGIKTATADWIVFTDSDDVMLPEYLEYLYRAVSTECVQMGFCHMRRIPMESKQSLASAGPLELQTMTAAEAMKCHYSDWIAPVCLVLDRAWIREKSLQFDETCHYCEDLMFITECIAAADRVCEIRNVLYQYRTHAGSLLRSMDTQKYANGLESLARMEKRLAGQDSEAISVYRSIGRPRYLLATLRRAALQLPWTVFRDFAKKLGYENYSRQTNMLPGKWKIAGYMCLVSKRLFYICVRMLFSD